MLQINSVARSGSTGRIVQELAIALNASGHECLVASGRDGGEQADIAIGTKLDLLGHVAMSRILDGHGRGSRRATRRFLDEVRSAAPDVVHLHNAHGYFVNLEALLLGMAQLEVPVVWTLHDCWAFTGHCAYFDDIGCDRWKTGCGACPQIHSYPASWGLDRSAASFRLKKDVYSRVPSLTLVTPSRWLASLASDSILGHAPIHVIENDPDQLVFRPRGRVASRVAASLHPERFIILAVASIWDRRKGLADLVELSRHLSDDEELVVVGKLSRRERLPPRLEHRVGTASPDAMAQLYSGADVFVNPTMEDNYPSTNLEALACGTPVITYASGGSGEAIERGEGVVLEERTPAGLRLAIDEVRRRSNLKNDSESLLRPADGGSMVDRYLSLYRSLTGLSG